ncbi:MAG: hypothetical protein ACM3US_02845 [Sphingomonadaceae bacterium]
MIIITPEAAKELRDLAASGEAAVLKFDAEPDNEGGYDCSVGLVDTPPSDAIVEEIAGVKVAFLGMAESVFEGAVVGLSPEGELTLEMIEEDCEHCEHEHGCDCGEGNGCSSEGHI